MKRHRINRLVMFAAMATASLSLPLTAQTASQTDVPVIEPTFTRIFGSDTLEIYGASLSPDGRWVAYGHELRAWTPEQGSRVLHTFGDQQSGSVGVNGNRIVFIEYSADRARLRTTTLGDAESRELTSVVGWLQMGAWSPDGRHVAVVHVDTTGGWESARVALLQVSPSGEPIGDLRYVSEPSLSWWNLRWLPDSRGVVAVGWDGHNVWFFPVDPTERPVCLTQDNPKDVYGFVLSPDGQPIVYPSWQPRGSSIWLVDLGDMPGVSK